MNDWKENLLKVFMYAGLEKEEYEGIREEIRKNNRALLGKFIRIGLVIFTGMYLLSYEVDTIAKNQLLYLGLMMLMLFMEGLQRTAFLKIPKTILPGCYLMLGIIYGYAIVVGVINENFPATTFCVLLFAAPLMYMDKPWRMTLFMTVTSMIFCIVSWNCKPLKVASMDIVNTVCFLALGILCNTQLLYTKAKAFAQNKKITNERDTDGLTGLLVKSTLERDICHYIKMTRDAGALIIIDLDNFKTINDTMGHAYGDKVLELTGNCIDKAFGDADIKGRFGGDEFIIFVRGKSGRRMIVERLEHFRTLMYQGAGKGSGIERISQSIGVALYPEDGGDYKTLFEKADEALYEAKKRGKDQYCFYTSVKINRTHG